MMRNLASGLLVAWLSSAMPLWASQQSEPEAAAEQIVVTGERTPEEVVRDFVRGIAEEAGYDQLARWEEPICPYIDGLEVEQNVYIAETVTAVAAAVGAEAAEPGCNANLIVAFTSEPQFVVYGWVEQMPRIFESLNPRERAVLRRSEAPVRSWNMYLTRGSDGRLTPRLPVSVENPNPDIELVFGVYPSRIIRATRVDFGMNFIVIDRRHVEDMTLQQLSGFVTMLALAQIDIDNPVRPERSILNLLHRAEARPDDLSDWDIAYLRALYASDNRRSATAQRGQIMRIMRETLIEETDD